MTQAVVIERPSPASSSTPICSIPAHIFIKAGAWPYARSRLNLVGTEYILQQSETFLGVSGFQLARLLGSNWPSLAVNTWRNGKQGLGTLYMGRILYLWWLKIQGMDVCYMQKIDWETGTIHWRKNGHKNHLSNRGGSVSDQKGGN